MSAEELLLALRGDLKANRDQNAGESAQRFFKEPILCYGMKTSIARKIAAKYWKTVKKWKKNEILALSEILLASGYLEEAFMAAEWLPKIIDQLTPDDLPLFKSWGEKYLDNWAKCDTFGNHTLGGLLENYPEQVIPELLNWAKNPNPRLRRLAAVSLVLPARKGKFLPEVFALADILRDAPEDLVQKGYGWMLKEASRQHPQAVLEYVLRHKATLPRTALRYAVELLPPDARKKAMQRD